MIIVRASPSIGEGPVGDGLITVVSDPNIHRAARLHLERHSDEAVAKARDMVRNLKERGDNEAADTCCRSSS